MIDLDNLIARVELQTLKAKHMHAVDIEDWDYFGSLLTDSFILDLSAAVPVPRMEGKEQALAAVKAGSENSVMVHHVHQPEFDFLSDHEVRIIWAMQDRIVRGEEQSSLNGFGQHHDRWVKQDGQWKLAEQRLTRFHVDVLPPARIWPREPNQKINPEPFNLKDLESISEWLALCDAKARYCRYLDTKNWEGFGDLMTEDFELDLSATSDVGTISGRDEVLKSVRSSIETAKTAHQVHAPEISINGDEADVIWAMQDRVLKPDGSLSLVGFGHYNEIWRKVNGEWKLAKQKLTRLHMDFLPIEGQGATSAH